MSSHLHQPLFGLLLLQPRQGGSEALMWLTEPPALALLLVAWVPAGFRHSQDLA